MKNIKREALLVPIIGLLILSYHMGYFLSDWPFWQVYAIWRWPTCWSFWTEKKGVF